MSSLAWDQSFVGSEWLTQLAQNWPVHFVLTANQVCPPLDVWSNGWPSSTCGTGISSLLLPSSTALLPSCPRLWLMGNRKFWCKVLLCPSPSMGHTTYTGNLNRAADPPHTPALPPILDFVSALEGGGMDQDHVTHPQGHWLATFIIVTFMVPHLLLLKKVGLPVGPPNVVPQLLEVLGASGCSYWLWGESQGDINRELSLSLINEEVGAKASGGILGTVVSIDQHSNTALPVQLVFWGQHPQHINQGVVKPVTLAIHLGVIWADSEFLDPCSLTKISYVLALKIPPLIQGDFLWLPIVNNETVPEGLCCCLGHLGSSAIHQGIVGEMVHYCQLCSPPYPSLALNRSNQCVLAPWDGWPQYSPWVPSVSLL